VTSERERALLELRQKAGHACVIKHNVMVALDEHEMPEAQAAAVDSVGAATDVVLRISRRLDPEAPVGEWPELMRAAERHGKRCRPSRRRLSCKGWEGRRAHCTGARSRASPSDPRTQEGIGPFG